MYTSKWGQKLEGAHTIIMFFFYFIFLKDQFTFNQEGENERGSRQSHGGGHGNVSKLKGYTVSDASSKKKKEKKKQVDDFEATN